MDEKNKPYVVGALALIVVVVYLLIYAPNLIKFANMHNSNSQKLDSEFNATTITLITPTSTQNYGAYLATTLPQQELGYMNQTGLGDCHGISPCIGMLFVFNTESDLCFWMENTIMPLKQVWINQNNTVVYIANATPYSTQTICYNGSSVLEMSPTQQISIGDKISIT